MAEKYENLYLDFRRNSDRLIRQLQAIRQLHGSRMFPRLTPDTPVLVYFVQTVFEIGIPRDYFIANTSLKDHYVDLTIRPRMMNRLRAELPPGVSLAIRGHLFPTHHPSPELVVDRIIDIADAPQRDFEMAVTATPRFSDSNRPDNLLTRERVRELPEISRQTRENLRHWFDYLAWKRAILESQLTGLRYIDVALTGDQIDFTVAVPGEETLRDFERTLQKSEMSASPLRISAHPWEFRYAEGLRYPPAAALGEFLGWEKVSVADFAKPLRGCPWSAPLVARLRFRLSETDRQELHGIAPAHTAGFRTELLRKFPEQGFLSVSLLGDFTVLYRQQQALESLEMQSGYAPYLSSWLFEIEKAHTPQIAPSVPDWLMPNINEGQKKAVIKMLSAPDVALVQGPPGTGKTTVIGETIYQLVRQGKRVLLAAQANLAVDNALEKLAAVPDIRAIRLGRSHKLSAEGQDFAEDRVLRKFYDALAAVCEERFLRPWEQQGRRSTLETHLSAVEQSLQKVAELAAAVRTQSGTRAQPSPPASDGALHLLKCQLTALRDFLNSPAESTAELDIPPKIFAIIERGMLHPLQNLRKYQIDLFPPGENGHPAPDKTAQFRILFSNWQHVRGRIPALERVVNLLSANTAANGQKVRELESRLAKLRATATGEPGAETAALLLQEQIRALQAPPPAADVLQIFNARHKGAPFAQRLHHPALNPEKRATFLRHALSAVKKTDQQVEKTRALLIRHLSRMVAEIAARQKSDPSPDTTADIAGLQNALRQEQSALAARLRRLRDRALLAPEECQDPKTAARTLRKKLAALPPEPPEEREFREKWQPFLQRWHGWLRDPAQVKNDNQHYIETYMANCNVVGVTCNENPRLLSARNMSCFDVAIIDEVSKATPPELLMPMLLAKKSILVGDHRQLPPLFKEREGAWEEVVNEGEEDTIIPPAARQLLTRENFLRFRDMVTASLFKTYFENAPSAIKETLLVQYRMHPDIMAVVNHFYEHRLRCGLKNPDVQRHHGLDLPAIDGGSFLSPAVHTLWVDSSRDAAGQPHYEQQHGTSKINTLEAALMVELLRRMDAAYGAQKPGRDRKAVGVISFYAGQVAEIRRRLRSERFAHLDIDVNTVDQFQGKEKPIVLVSLVRHTPPGRQINRAFVTRFERINVAFSRAQELLVIFGARQMFAGCEVTLPYLDRPGFVKTRVYGDIIDMLQKKSALRDASQLLDRQQPISPLNTQNFL